MKVGELSGEALDWAVAVADGRIPEDCDTVPTDGFSYSSEGYVRPPQLQPNLGHRQTIHQLSYDLLSRPCVKYYAK
jgi:hypothetical protein